MTLPMADAPEPLVTSEGWTWEEHELSEGFSCIVYDEHGRAIADHLDRATAAKVAAAPALYKALLGLILACQKAASASDAFLRAYPSDEVDAALAALALARGEQS